MRGRCSVPARLRRMRSRIRPRDATLCFAWSMSYLLACGLAGLPANHFVGVLDAFALVRIGLAEGTDLRRGLPDELLVVAGDGDVTGLGVDGDFDPLRDRELHRVGVSELEH